MDQERSALKQNSPEYALGPQLREAGIKATVWEDEGGSLKKLEYECRTGCLKQ